MVITNLISGFSVYRATIVRNSEDLSNLLHRLNWWQFTEENQ